MENFLLVDEGRFREAETGALLGSGRTPTRNPDQNLADLKAQIAACAKVAEILRLCVPMARHGPRLYGSCAGQCGGIGAPRYRPADGGVFACRLDNGATIKVAISVSRADRTAKVDFHGTSAQAPHNSMRRYRCRAVLYVFRTLIDDDIPLNDGCMRPIELIVPEGSLLNPRYPAAVVAGNVETSQAITDALYGALGLMAAAQGSMNNFTFGDCHLQYYETICGGSGAGPSFDGASAVHTHMTNTRLTDPEVLETRFPVLVEEFSIRRGSGGEGRHKGGDGAVRRIRFRANMSAAILSNRRRVAPFGLEGGEPGAPGRNSVERQDGSVETLSATAIVQVKKGDAFVIETPGGGGFGGPGGSSQ